MLFMTVGFIVNFEYWLGRYRWVKAPLEACESEALQHYR